MLHSVLFSEDKSVRLNSGFIKVYFRLRAEFYLISSIFSTGVLVFKLIIAELEVAHIVAPTEQNHLLDTKSPPFNLSHSLLVGWDSLLYHVTRWWLSTPVSRIVLPRTVMSLIQASYITEIPGAE